MHYKLKPTHLEVKENGVTLVQADLPFPVQVEDSNWQFGEQHLCEQASACVPLQLMKNTCVESDSLTVLQSWNVAEGVFA